MARSAMYESTASPMLPSWSVRYKFPRQYHQCMNNLYPLMSDISWHTICSTLAASRHWYSWMWNRYDSPWGVDSWSAPDPLPTWSWKGFSWLYNPPKIYVPYSPTHWQTWTIWTNSLDQNGPQWGWQDRHRPQWAPYRTWWDHLPWPTCKCPW